MKQTRISKWLVVAAGCIILMLGAAATAAAGNEQDLVAVNFLKFLRSDKRIIASEVLQGNRLNATLLPIPIAHLYHLEDGGYLLIAAARSLTPVKAYSLTGDFGGLPPNYKVALLEEMEALNRTIPEAGGRTTLSSTALENQSRWDFLVNLESTRMPLAYTPDTWLVKTTWNQGYPYNRFTPKIDGQNTLTGCVNTALAQVLRYHRYPAASRGVVSYTWDGQPLKAVLYKSYNWDRMPEVLDSTTPDDRVGEAASLIADLGIANNTVFGLTNSSASFKSNVLIDHFGYSTALSRMDNADIDAFFTTLKGELDAERPVLLSFPGHMVVADGYASDGAGRKIHINMGWGGSYDNFYFLDQTVQAGSSSFDTTVGSLDIYYNIKPCSGSDCGVNLETGDGMTGMTLTGRFDIAKDVDRYDIYLKGDTAIRASRGYSNLAFHIYLYNRADYSLIKYMSGTTTANVDVSAGNLPVGKYIIKISLCDNIGYCYDAAGHEQYTVTVTSATLTEAEKAAIDQSLDISPVINNTFKNVLLNSANPSPYRILLDARDENGDAVALEVKGSNGDAFSAILNGNILEITPIFGASGVAGKITVRASANGKVTEKSFVVMVAGETAGFGKAFEVKGLFENQSGFNLHRVVLDGACTISGFNGYSNQAFYSSVLNMNGTPRVAANDAEIVSTFARGVYQLGASLKQNPGGAGYYYTYDAGVNDRYTLTVSCPDADESTGTVAALLGIDLSGLGLRPGDINGDTFVNLTDAILALQVTTGMAPSAMITAGADVNADAKIGLAEAVYILQTLSGVR